MIRFSIHDPDTLYEHVLKGFTGSVGRTKLGHYFAESSGKSPDLIYIMETELRRIGQDTQISTVFDPQRSAVGTDISPHWKIPGDEIAQEVGQEYQVEINVPSQLELLTGKRSYTVSLGTLQAITFDTTQRITSRSEFDVMLTEYTHLFETLTRAFYKPIGTSLVAIHTIGKEYAKEIPQSDSSPLLVSQNNTEESLDKLERKIEITSPHVLLKEVMGCDGLKAECMRIYRDLINPERAYFFGRDPAEQKNILITGEKGGGKTMTVSALATLLKEQLDGKVKFYVVEYPTITSMFRGGEAQATSHVFELVNRNEAQGMATILFLDEVHQVAERRKDYNEALDVLLTKLDGIQKLRKTVVFSATYRDVNLLDPAFVDRHHMVTVDPLTAEQKVMLFKQALEKRVWLAREHGHPSLVGDVDYTSLQTLLSRLNGRAIASPYGAVTGLVNWKDDHTDDSTTYTPITTQEIITFLEQFRFHDKLRSSPKPIGF